MVEMFFLRVMNSKSEPSELKFGTRVATFSPLVQSHGKSGSASSSVKAETVGDNKAKFNREFTFYTDASDVGLGFVLSQHDDNGIETRVVAYESRSLTPRERNYATTEKEALAIHYAWHAIFSSLSVRPKIYNSHRPQCPSLVKYH